MLKFIDIALQTFEAFASIVAEGQFHALSGPWNYIRARLLVCRIWLGRNTNICHVWKARLQHFNITPATFTWQHYNQQWIAYVRLTMSHSAIYIGMCEYMVARNHTRDRKYKQVKHKKLAHAEPAIHWWVQHNNYWKYTSIPLLSHPTKAQAFATEAQYTHLWQAQLNNPYISQHFKAKTWTPAKHITRTTYIHKPSTKLWRRYRHKTSQPSSTKLFATPGNSIQHQAWTILFHLASTSFRRYQTSRLLRSNRYSSHDIYALHRMAMQTQEPDRTLIISQIRKVMHFKQLHVPCQPSSLRIPILCHPQSTTATNQWLSNFLTQHRNLALPFHIPPRRILPTNNKTIAHILHNWRQLMFRLANGYQPQCQCSQILALHPDTPTHDDHIVAPGHLLPDTWSDLLAAHADSTFYPSQTAYRHLTTQTLLKWLHKHHVTVSEQTVTQSWNHFLSQQWPIHLQHISPDHITWQKLQFTKQQTEGLVIHCADHKAKNLTLYCEVFYYQSIQRTMSNHSIFCPVDINMQQALALTHSALDDPAVCIYKSWAIDLKAALPFIYFFLKESKLYRKARPVISFAQAPLRPLYKVLHYILTLMVATTYHHAFHSGTMPTMMQALHRFLHKRRQKAAKLIMDNTDLSGFFTSVPHDRIIASVQHLMLLFYPIHASSRDTWTSLQLSTACEHQSDKVQRVMKGKFRKAAKIVRTIGFSHIPQLVQTILTNTYFLFLQRPWKQVQGACIGMPCAGILCDIVAAFEEFLWAVTYNMLQDQRHLHGHAHDLFVMRYVDNRLNLIDQMIQGHSGVKALRCLDFYKDPIILEHTDNNKLLGFQLHIDNQNFQHEMRFILPDEPWQIRSAHTATTMKLLLSSFTSRIWIIKRGTFPACNRFAMYSRLMQLYIAKGYSASQLSAIVNKVERNCISTSPAA